MNNKPSHSDNFFYICDEIIKTREKLREKFPITQQWIDYIYPQESICLHDISNCEKRRDQIDTLTLSNLNLSGKLDLSGFINLKKLDCSHNQLIEVVLPVSNQLEEILINDNFLTSFDYLILNCETLTKFRSSDNNLEETNIEVFSELICLKDLSIGNENKEKIETEIYNRFYGSLQSLEHSEFLEHLDISNTDISDGLVFLIDSNDLLVDLYISIDLMPNCKLREIWEANNLFDLFEYDVFDWEKFKHRRELEIAKSRIPTLENKLLELIRLIEEKKDLVVEAYICLFPKDKRGLFSQLIYNKLELSYFEIKEDPELIIEFQEKYNEIYYKLKATMTKDDFCKVALIIAHCGKLGTWRSEIEDRINSEKLLTGISNQTLILKNGKKNSGINTVVVNGSCKIVYEISHLSQINNIQSIIGVGEGTMINEFSLSIESSELIKKVTNFRVEDFTQVEVFESKEFCL